MNETEDKYLLSDDEFYKLMEGEYQKAGAPVDDVKARRQWMQIQNKLGQSRSRRNGLVWGSVLGVAAALFLMVRFQNLDLSPESPQMKGHGPGDYRLRWISSSGQEKDVISASEIAQHRLRLSFDASLTFGVFGKSETQKDIRDLLPKETTSGSGQKDLDIPVEAFNGIDRVCAVAGTSEDEFGKLKSLLDSTWNMLATEQCVGIHFGN